MSFKAYLFVFGIILWCACGMYGEFWYPKNKPNYPLIFFVIVMPIFPIVGLLAGIF